MFMWACAQGTCSSEPPYYDLHAVRRSSSMIRRTILLRGNMSSCKVLLFLCLSLALSLAQANPPASSNEKRPSGNVGFSADMLDKSADPCTDFYAYACSKWKAQNPIPSDRPSWGRFNELQERGEYIMRDILDKYTAADPKQSAIEQKIGDYYQSCMDESTIEKLGTKPLAEDLQRVASLKSKQDLAPELVRLHREGANVLFSFDSTQDFGDATQVIAEADQGGMGLPDRDYYLKDDPKSVDLRKQYVAHVQMVVDRLGDPPEKAAAAAKVVHPIETSLAKGALDRVSRRDPNKVYHKMSDKQLAALSPNFGWDRYLASIGAPSVSNLNVTEPDFFKNLNAVVNGTSLDDWKMYLRWHVVHANAPMLPTAFVDENFNFFSKALQGTKELAPRWKRCVRATNGDLGEAVGQKYVEATFGPEGKQRTLAMVNALEKSLSEDIQGLPWMGPDTKKQALVKLQAITNRIGYPNKWRDYSTLNIVRGDALGNSQRSNIFEFQRQLNKIGKPVDKNDWPYPPATVNASYNSTLNNITFPAGILQPPFYDNKADDAMNFGGIGAVVGHELTHGFDDQGRKFDPQGNLRDWWTEQDGKEFENRASCIADEYGNFVSIDDLKLNGKLTLGENTADNGGARIALMALMSMIAEDKSGKAAAKIDGYTPEQRF